MEAYKIQYVLRRRGYDVTLVGIAFASDEESAIKLVEEAAHEKIQQMKEDYKFVFINIKKAKYDFLVIEKSK